MIEISQRNNIWELYLDGALWHYDESLESVIEWLYRRRNDVVEEIENH